MSKRRKNANSRDKPATKSFPMAWLCSTDAYDTLCCQGYRRLSDCPEVLEAVNYIANLVASMTIYLMQNTDKGDRRVKNELSRKLDINPNPPMTRKTWVYTIVRTMLLEGTGNCIVLPIYSGEEYLERLKPIPPDRISFADISENGYRVLYGGIPYSPEEVLHFVWGIDPHTPYIGQGVRAALKDVVQNLKQASKTKEGFMESKWKPSVIVKVDAMAGDMATPDGRNKILKDYIDNDSSGKPWVIPSEFIEVEQIKPLSLQDLAINEAVTIDKKTVAALFGVPAFAVGAGQFNKAEYNNFVDTVILPICLGIQQELTNKLLYRHDWYFKFNPRSLYAYTLPELISAGESLVDRMAMRRNEWRDMIGLEPDDEMEELLALENYLPVAELAKQKKLIQSAIGGEKD